jgi:hypothetical protein
LFDLVRMEVALKVAQVAQQQRKHSEVSIYKEPGSEVYYYRAQVHGRRFKRSTGKTNYKEALVQAKVIARELRHDGQARTTMKRPGYASVGDLLAVWLERSPALTRGNNASTLRKWVRSFAGADADAVSMTRLTAEELERYLRAWPGSPEGRASTWRQIRAVFADQPRRWYAQAGLVLPDLTELRLVRAETSARELRVRGYKLDRAGAAGDDGCGGGGVTPLELGGGSADLGGVCSDALVWAAEFGGGGSALGVVEAGAAVVSLVV